jgi:hypothetical protein
MRCGARDRRNPQPSIDGRELALKIVLLVQAGARTVSQPPTPGFWWLVGDDRYMGLAGEIGQHNRRRVAPVLAWVADRA